MESLFLCLSILIIIGVDFREDLFWRIRLSHEWIAEVVKNPWNESPRRERLSSLDFINLFLAKTDL